MQEKQKYYITTPIYYPSGKWHLGHCYTTVLGDAIARFKRLDGFDVFYLTGTDEHGQKIETRAAEAGVSPKVFVDGLVDSIKDLWKLMDISYDKFIRTTDGYHISAVQKIFKTLYDKGYIYKSRYKGKYCTPCESFWTVTQAVDGKCPDCGRPVQDSEEESYFFALSKFSSRIKTLLTTTDFLQPKSRVNEMVNNFLDAGLEDLAVSRTSFKWGIPVEFDPGHVVYVWIDALSNYITALGYLGDEGAAESEMMQKYWPADLHLMAKEIVRFHSIIWPAILMALDLPLPKKVVGHGWLLFGGDKMSKSKGNVVDPFVLAERYGVDSLRYYLLRAMPFGSDGLYTSEALLTRINTDLANDLGNLVKRTVAMATQYFGGKVDKPASACQCDEEFISLINGLTDKVRAEVQLANASRALEVIFDVISFANKYIDTNCPWTLNKNNQTERLNAVLYNLLEALRNCATMLLSFIPSSAAKIFVGLGMQAPTDFVSAKFGAVNQYNVVPLESLFPRLDVKKEIEQLENLNLTKQETTQSTQTSQDKNQDKSAETSQDKNQNKSAEKPALEQQKSADGMISIDEFFKTQLKVAEVIAAEKLAKSKKLLKLTLKVGSSTRTVVSGIALSYTAEEMVGKQVILVANLAPAKLCGVESEGMILCATDGDKVVLVSPSKLVQSGAEVC